MEHSNDVVLTDKDLAHPALWYFLRMPAGTIYDHDFWWGYAGWEGCGWYEGENPFKGWRVGEDIEEGDVVYLKSLDKKGEKITYKEPQGKRAFFVVSDMEDAINALGDVAASFSLSYEGGVLKLLAWNEEKPDFKACLMRTYDWEIWCEVYFQDRYSDFAQKMLEYSYGINAPDPVWKDGKLVFGDEFSKTPEEFVEDLVKAAQKKLGF